MKRVILFVLAAFLIHEVALSQAISAVGVKSGSQDLLLAALLQPAYQPTPQDMAQRETEWMTTALTLTPDQVVKVNAIHVKYAEQQMNQFQGDGARRGGDPESMQSQRAEMNAKKRKEFEPVLTAGQLEKYDTALAERQTGRGGRGSGFPPNRQ